MKFFLALCVFTILSCQQGESNAPKQGENIYYYPTSNVYFDADNNLYMLLNAAEGWVIREELSTEQTANLGRKVLVAHPTVPVYKANADHKMIYGASLYTTNDEYRQKFTEDSLNSFPKKTISSEGNVSPDSITERKKKRGVGKLLDRLFGPKDKTKQ